MREIISVLNDTVSLLPPSYSATKISR